MKTLDWILLAISIGLVLFVLKNMLFQSYQKPTIEITQELPQISFNSGYSVDLQPDNTCARMYSSDSFCRFYNHRVDVPSNVDLNKVVSARYVVEEVEGYGANNMLLLFNGRCDFIKREPRSSGLGYRDYYQCSYTGQQTYILRYQSWSGTFIREIPIEVVKNGSFDLSLYFKYNGGEYATIKKHKIVYSVLVECLVDSDCPESAPICQNNKCILSQTTTIPTTTTVQGMPSGLVVEQPIGQLTNENIEKYSTISAIITLTILIVILILRRRK